MIATILGAVWQSPFLRKLVIGAAFLGGLFVLHQVDKAAAVRIARTGLVAKAELTAARAELQELKRRKTVADAVNRELQTEIEKATADAEATAQELEHHVSTVEDSCVVQPALVDRLRNR
ncbi:hypothetical protein [Roseibium aggregatum]|uniref:Uncharacterized protein n=1 Tax=Roseibium aggregatum TaxID=187304 RepID=A0A939EED7_9HYPH|nr:hypothetical protein [Roseibium aggregatum]MBN9671687.1 hypothetical protein [Roseibium aggregatum]